jgi:hypothetical protein
MRSARGGGPSRLLCPGLGFGFRVRGLGVGAWGPELRAEGSGLRV